MKKHWFILAVSALLVFSGIAHAADSSASSQGSGAGNKGLFFSLAYDGSNWESRSYRRDGSFYSKHSGWTDGLAVEARYETKELWIRGGYGHSDSSNSGSLAIGYKILNMGPSTLTPFVGIGYLESDSNSGHIISKGRTGYVPIGLNYVYNFDGWSLGAETAVRIPFSMRISGRDNTTGSEGAADINSAISFKAELPITVDLYKSKPNNSFKVFALLTPYYQYSDIGPSENLTINGSTGYYVENISNTFGFKCGVGINF